VPPLCSILTCDVKLLNLWILETWIYIFFLICGQSELFFTIAGGVFVLFVYKRSKPQKTTEGSRFSLIKHVYSGNPQRYRRLMLIVYRRQSRQRADRSVIHLQPLLSFELWITNAWFGNVTFINRSNKTKK